MTSGEGLRGQDLGFSYSRHAPPVVSGLSVHVPRGSLTALTGRSGSGKSTALYVLALMLRPSSGAITWDGRALASARDRERAAWRAATSGFVFQDAMLDPSRTVLDNVLEGALFSGSPRRRDRRTALALLEEFGVSHRYTHRPGEISGGQAQRVALCRALIGRPQVIFADEPTGNLDDDTAQVVWQALRSRADDGAAVVVATHDRTLARTADTTLVLT